MDDNNQIHSGIDIIEIARIKNVLTKHPKRFLEKIFTEYERNYCRGRPTQLAARFAAKEALSKSFGTGIRDNLSFKDIEILNDKMGKPFFYKSKKIDKIIKKKFKIKKYDLFLSLSDEKDHSIAFTILVKK